MIKMIMEYRFKLITAALILVSGIALLFSTQLPSGFEQHISNAPDNATKLDLTGQYIAQTDDIEDLRTLQDIWLGLDKAGCISYFQSLHNKNPKDPKNYYLYARTQDDWKFKTNAGRELIKNHPDFEYGFRMLLTYYQQFLFGTPGPEHPAAQQLLKDYKADKKYFQTYMDRFPNNENALYLEVQRLVWEHDVKNANLMVAKALRMNVSWLNWQFYTDFYLRTKQFELLQAYVRRTIDDSKYFQNKSTAEKEKEFEESYIMTLINGGAYAEGVRFFEEHPNLFSFSVFRMLYLKACVQTGLIDKALTLLDNELIAGTDWYDELVLDKDFQLLRNDARWEARLDKFFTIQQAKQK